jgi:hypothetical protein
VGYIEKSNTFKEYILVGGIMGIKGDIFGVPAGIALKIADDSIWGDQVRSVGIPMEELGAYCKKLYAVSAITKARYEEIVGYEPNN